MSDKLCVRFSFYVNMSDINPKRIIIVNLF